MEIPTHPFETIQVSKLVFDEANPNEFTAAQMENLKASLKEYGNLQPIVVDQGNRIVDGAHRAIAYMELGAAEIPVIRVKLENDTDRRIIRQTMNKLRGRHDPKKDAEEFVAILKANQEKKLFEISSIREGDFYRTLSAFGKDQQKNPDFIPEIDEDEIITEKGDIWICGNHRIMCGDSLDPNDVAKLMGPDKAHIVVTDPPYGVDYVAQIEGREGTTSKWKDIKGDDLKGKALQEFCEKFLNNIKAHTTDDSAYYIFFGMKTFHHLLAAMDATKIYYALPLIWYKARTTISWVKYHPDYEVLVYGGQGSKPARFKTDKKVGKVYSSGQAANNYKPDYEPIAFSGAGASPRQPRWFARYDQTTTWIVKPDASMTYGHPTQKPVELAERALLNASREGEIVLDLFMGSGFALIASHKLKRAFRGMDCEPMYVEVSVKRWELYSGMRAYRLGKDPVPENSGTDRQNNSGSIEEEEQPCPNPHKKARNGN